MGEDMKFLMLRLERGQAGGSARNGTARPPGWPGR
jgi:hypothetical protein